MNRREFLKKSISVSFLATASGYAAELFAKNDTLQMQKQPNVIFLFSDDGGWGDYGFNGHKKLKTPNFDKLAAQSTVFNQFYTNSPVCTPSRVGFMTGMFPATLHFPHIILANDGDWRENPPRDIPQYLDPNIPNVAKVFKKSGYCTGHFGKWHLGLYEWPKHIPVQSPEKYGFDDYCILRGSFENTYQKRFGKNGQEFMMSQHSTLITNDGIDFVERNQNKPFYLQLWYVVPHSPLEPNAEQIAVYPPGTLSPEDLEKDERMRHYYAMMTDLDKNIGRLLDKLDDLGLAENTIIVYSSDNGPEQPCNYKYSYGTTPFLGRKRSLYEGGIREPLIMRWPDKIPAGRMDDTTVIAGCDYLPSICKLCNTPLPKDYKFDGEDMSQAMLGKKQQRTKDIMWEFSGEMMGDSEHQSPMLAIRSGDWKLLTNLNDNRTELYNIPKDRLEENNLAEKYPDKVKELKEKLFTWQEKIGPHWKHPNAGKKGY